MMNRDEGCSGHGYMWFCQGTAALQHCSWIGIDVRPSPRWRHVERGKPIPATPDWRVKEER
jgi:hypothetical protein